MWQDKTMETEGGGEKVMNRKYPKDQLQCKTLNVCLPCSIVSIDVNQS